jgi:hypothetical protein
MGGCGDSGCPVHIHADVVTLVPGRLTGVQSHPHPQSSTVGPGVGGESVLSCQRGANSVYRRREDDEEAVTFRADFATTPVTNFFANDGALNGQRFPVLHPQLAQQAGRTLDVAEQQGERRRWAGLLHHLSMTT